ncbi:signal recognition particle-docking protein FtsY [Massilia sp. PAMC28688]|uniref:signal recognition particle-docking protein FtsY n=1 Tax=Massilia sp. PAMC28688 TaxID=2861283 RepID=UPI0035A68395
MFSFFKKKPPPPEIAPPPPPEPVKQATAVAPPEVVPAPLPPAALPPAPAAPAPVSSAAVSPAYVPPAHVPPAYVPPAYVPPVGVQAVDVAPVDVPPVPAAEAPVTISTPPATPAPAVSSRRYGTTSTFVPPPVAPPPPPEPVYEPEPEPEPEPEVEIIPETAERPTTEAEKKKTWMERLKSGLSKTSSNLSLLFVGAKIDEDLYEELEAALLMSDAGMDATQFLLDGLRRKVKDERLLDAAAVKGALRVLMTDMLRPLEKPLELGRYEPLVMMIAGVNGAGKTTTIGKLAKHMQKYQQSVLLAAGDTFRAAAREQLMVWGQRNNVTVIAQESGDPAAVAFDAVQSGKARKMDVVMVDTAGRLPTQLHLMEELKKIKRVIGKGMDGAPHEVVLVIDGNTGQNALAQVKAFDDALSLTGLVITKLDGTAKGGVLAAIARTRPIPVYFIGVGEKLDDLQPFKADEFVEALLG